MRSNQAIALVAASCLVMVLLLDSFSPNGFLYSYFNPSITKPSRHRRHAPATGEISGPSVLEPRLIGTSYSSFASSAVTQRKVWRSYGSPDYFWGTYWYGSKLENDKLFWAQFDAGWEQEGTLAEWDSQEKGASSTLIAQWTDLHCNGTSGQATTVAGQNALLVKNFNVQTKFDARLYVEIPTPPSSGKIGWFMLLYNDTALKIAVGFKTVGLTYQMVFRYLNTSSLYQTLFTNITYTSSTWYGIKAHFNVATNEIAFSNSSAVLYNLSNLHSSAVINKLKVGVNSTGSEAGAMQTLIDCVVCDPNTVDFESPYQGKWMYTSSPDGTTWRSPTNFANNLRQWVYKPWDEMLDWSWQVGTNIAAASMPYREYGYWVKAVLNDDGTLTATQKGSGVASHFHIGGKHTVLDGKYCAFYIDRRPYTGIYGETLHYIDYPSVSTGYSQAVPGAWGTYSITTGGCSTLAINSTYGIYLGKQGDNKLYWNYTLGYAIYSPPTSNVLVLKPGFNTFSAASELEASWYNPSITTNAIHLVAIKSTGELVYLKFVNTAWTGETVLCSSGASYPIVAIGAHGDIYVLYIRDGRIRLTYFDGEQWVSEIDLFPSVTFHNVGYLSTNQMAQDGKILLEWTEDNVGGSEPYAVWFSYIVDE